MYHLSIALSLALPLKVTSKLAKTIDEAKVVHQLLSESRVEREQLEKKIRTLSASESKVCCELEEKQFEYEEMLAASTKTISEQNAVLVQLREAASKTESNSEATRLLEEKLSEHKTDLSRQQEKLSGAREHISALEQHLKAATHEVTQARNSCSGRPVELPAEILSQIIMFTCGFPSLSDCVITLFNLMAVCQAFRCQNQAFDFSFREICFRQLGDKSFFDIRYKAPTTSVRKANEAWAANRVGAASPKPVVTNKLSSNTNPPNLVINAASPKPVVTNKLSLNTNPPNLASNSLQSYADVGKTAPGRPYRESRVTALGLSFARSHSFLLEAGKFELFVRVVNKRIQEAEREDKIWQVGTIFCCLKCHTNCYPRFPSFIIILGQANGSM